jgi:transcription initiation factor TFIID TATA-box-binding protein
LQNYRIENIIASTNLNSRINLPDVAKKLENVEYNPDNFPGAIWRPANSYGVALIFQDGRLMCTNTRSIQEVETIFKKLTKRLEELELINPRTSCPNCGAAIDTEDMVCIECGSLFNK